MSKIDFYTNPMSRGQIARWALHEVGADYDQHLMAFDATMRTPEYLAINPMGKVPAIVHDGKIVTECAAICAYLAEAFPQADLLPRPDERSDYFRWMFFAAGPVESAVTNHVAGFDPSPEKERMFGYGSYDRVVDVLDAMLSGREYICGDRFTAADIYVGAQADWGTQFGSIPPRSGIVAYAQRIQKRPAYQAAKAIDNALIAQARK